MILNRNDKLPYQLQLVQLWENMTFNPVGLFHSDICRNELPIPLSLPPSCWFTDESCFTRVFSILICLSGCNHLNATFGQRWTVVVQFNGLPDRPTHHIWLTSSGGMWNPLSTRPTLISLRTFCKLPCSCRGNPWHSLNVWKCSDFHAEKMCGLSHMRGSSTRTPPLICFDMLCSII